MEPEPLYDDDGQQIGWVAVAEDGNAYLTQLDGVTVVGVWDDEGQGWDVDIEPLELTYDEGEDEDAYEEQIAGFHDRLAALEQQSFAPRPVPEVVVTRATQEADLDRVNDELHADRARFESPGFAGRPMLLREQRAYGARAIDRALNGDLRPDLLGAAGELDDEGAMKLLDLDDGSPGQRREARQEFMVERFRDLERIAAAQRGEDDLLNEQPPATQDNYDLDNREERQAWMADRLRGVTDSGSTYSSLDLAQREDYT